MTLKNAGLSRFADAANPVDHYPVRRRGDRRRLEPNWNAIHWLEEDTAQLTAIESVDQLGNEGDWAQMCGVRAFGWHTAHAAGMYPRRMFDVFELSASSASIMSWRTPCEACDRFEVSWNCTEHPELDWSTEYRCWVRPGTPTWYRVHPEDRPEPQVEPEPTVYVDTGARPPGAGELYDRMIEMFGRPIPEFGGGRVRVVDATPPSGRQSFFGTLAEAREQEEYRLQDRLRGLPDFTITLTGHFDPQFLEITGESIDGSTQQIVFEVDPDA